MNGPSVTARLAVAAVILSVSTAAVGDLMPPLRTLLTVKDASSYPPKPMTPPLWGGTSRTERQIQFAADAKQPLGRMDKVLNHVKTKKTLDQTDIEALHLEAEAIANFFYSLVMFGNSRSADLYLTGGKAGNIMDSHTAYWALNAVRDGELYRNLISKSAETRDEISSGAILLSPTILGNLSTQDLRDMLGDEALEQYFKSGTISKSVLESCQALTQTKYRWNRVVGNEEIVRCYSKCNPKNPRECSCAQVLNRRAEDAYNSFVAGWNSANRWPLWRKRLELLDEFLGLMQYGGSLPSWAPRGERINPRSPQ